MTITVQDGNGIEELSGAGLAVVDRMVMDAD